MPAANGSGAPSCALPIGTSEYATRVGNVERQYYVHVSRAAAATGSAPVVFLWHGFGQPATAVIEVLEPERAWPGSIVVTPVGLPRRRGRGSQERERGWQAELGELGDRDLAFFDAMLGDLRASGCLDSRRIYSAGLSNGAIFTHLLGCARGDVLAAIAPVAGRARIDAASCVRPLPVLVTHGARDDVIPLSLAEAAVRDWAQTNRCTARPVQVGTCVALDGCTEPVVVCVHPGGHVWTLDATSTMVELFRLSRLPTPE